MTDETNVADLSFEDALTELEDIVSQLEAGELTLEVSLDLFARGQALAARCNQQLHEASLKVEMLTSDGEIVELSSTA